MAVTMEAFEQKTQPVPSSEKMALDLDINGASHPDETQDEIAPSNPELNQTSAKSPAPPPSTFTPTANGHVNNINLKAHSTNNSMSAPAPTPEDPAVAQIAEESSQDIQTQLPDTNTTTTDVDDAPQTTSTEEHEPATTSDLFDPVDSAIDSSFDQPAPSTVPPVVDAPESDLRDEVPPFGQEQLPVDTAGGQPPPAVDPTPENDLPVRPPRESATADTPNFTFDQTTNLPQPPSSNIEASPHTTPTTTNNNTSAPGDETSINHTPSVEPSMPVNDIEMTDAPDLQTSTKIPREREDDAEDEPSAKRTKTEETEIVPKEEEIDDAPHANHNGQNGESAYAENNNAAQISAYQAREVIKIIKNIVKTVNGKHFKAPVLELYPGLKEQYSAKVQNPIDLKTIEKKLKDSSYPSWDAFKSDLDLMGDNAEMFNSAEHAVTKAAREVRDSIMHKIKQIPSEPHVPIKKEKKPVPKKSTPVPEVPHAPAPRRLSRGSTSAPPKKPVPAESYAPNPTTGVPIIRRDSTQIDNDRPKRAIHPPKNKDLPYSSSRPKPKKGTAGLELKFCDHVLTEIMKPKHLQTTTPFLVPVDPVALAIPAYFTIVKNPMDLRTVGEKLRAGNYTKAKDFESDMKLIHSNCIKFNPPGNPVNAMGEQFLALFEKEWAKKDEYVAEQAERQRVVHSPESTNDEEEGSDIEIDLEVPAEVPPALTSRLAEEQAKLIDLLQKTPNSTELITMQKNLVAVVEKMIAEAKVAAKKVVKKPKAPKPAKKSAPPMKKARPEPPSKKPRAHPKHIGAIEKEFIQEAMLQIDEDIAGEVTELIKAQMEGLQSDPETGEIELEVDQIPVNLLWQLYAILKPKYPEILQSVRKRYEQRQAAPQLARPPPKKKNKPMSKNEQEKKIEQLQRSKQEFEQNRASGSPAAQAAHSAAPNVVQTIEHQEEPESSGDEASDSEEE